MAAWVKRQRKLGLLLHILLLALLGSQVSLLFQRASARALEAERKVVVVATDEVTNQLMKKEIGTPTTQDTTMGSNYYGGGGGYGGGWGHGGGGWGHGGGGSGHGGGGWGHGGGGWGHGGGGWKHHDGKKP